MNSQSSIRKQARTAGFGFLSIVLLLSLFSLGGVVQTLNLADEQDHAMERVHTLAAPLALSVRKMQLDVVQVQQFLSDVSATRGENGLDDGFDNAARHKDSFLEQVELSKKLAAQLGQDKIVKSIEATTAAFPSYYEMGVKMAHAYVDGGPAAGNKLMEGFDQKAANLGQILETLIGETEEEMTQDRDAGLAVTLAARNNSGLMSAVLLVVAAFGIVLSIILIKKMVLAATDLQNSRDVMLRAAAGDLNARMTHIRRADEIGQLMVSMNRVLDLTETFAKEIGAAMSAAERKEYFRYIPEQGLRGDFLRYVRSINAILAGMEARDAKTVEFEKSVKGMVEEVAASTAGIRSTANMMAHRSEAAGGRSLEVGEAAQATTGRAEVVSQATRQLVSSINEIADQATQSSVVAKAAVNQISATSSRMDQLSQAISQIGQVVGLINTIAGQTNLLALNATIEAARAGEAGRGFAVVANEVKNLANQTATATGTITDQVQTVQTAAREAVEAITEIVSTIESIEGIAAAIAGAVKQQEASTQEISHNIEGVVKEAEHVSDSVAKLSQSSAQSCAGTVRVIWSARKLAGVVDGMHGKVTDYIQSVS